MSKLPPIEQSWFDDNRERFNADSATLKLTGTKCQHYFIRTSGSDIKCKSCTAGWIDTKLTVVDGKILDNAI